MIIKRIAPVSICLLFTLCFTGCGSSSTTATTLQLGHVYQSDGIHLTITSVNRHIAMGSVPIEASYVGLADHLIRIDTIISNTTSGSLDVIVNLRTVQSGDGSIVALKEIPPTDINGQAFDYRQTPTSVVPHQQVSRTFYFGVSPGIQHMALRLGLQHTGSHDDWITPDLCIIDVTPT